MEKQKLIFASVIFPSCASEMNAILLASSIRKFGGELAKTQIWFFCPACDEDLSRAARDKLSALDAALVPLEVDEKLLQFPLAGAVAAAAHAESSLDAKTDLIAWLDSNTVILKEPVHFLLPDDKKLGYRPVHHINIGSRYAEPPDPFWTAIYRCCNVQSERMFPMTTHIDGMVIRPYINAGLLITRPECQLLRTWYNTFLKTYQAPALREFHQKDVAYAIFTHQAVLSGVIMAKDMVDELQELPFTYNYPLHLHAQDITDHKPTGLEDLVTFRHEGFYKDPEWMKKMPAGDFLKNWLAQVIRF